MSEAALQDQQESNFQALRFASLVGLTARLWRRVVDTRLQEYDLTEAMWLPLLHLARAKEPMRQKDIAAALSLDSSSVVRVLGNLEAAGLIEREEDEGDRRAKAIVITDAGRALGNRVEALSRDLEREILEGLTKPDVEAARRVLEQVCTMLTQLNDKGGNS